jgi:hypothetical protein
MAGWHKMGLAAFLELAMNSDEVYRRHAEEADKQARSRNALDRAAWLRVAQGWLGLLHKRRDSAGGNLAITLINRLGAAGEPLPACAWLICLGPISPCPAPR